MATPGVDTRILSTFTAYTRTTGSLDARPSLMRSSDLGGERLPSIESRRGSVSPVYGPSESTHCADGNSVPRHVSAVLQQSNVSTGLQRSRTSTDRLVANLPWNKHPVRTYERPWDRQRTVHRNVREDKATRIIQACWRRSQEDFIGFRVRKVMYLNKRKLGRKLSDFHSGVLHSLQVNHMETQREAQCLKDRVRSHTESLPVVGKCSRGDTSGNVMATKEKQPSSERGTLLSTMEGQTTQHRLTGQKIGTDQQEYRRPDAEAQEVEEEQAHAEWSAEDRIRSYLRASIGAGDAYFDPALRVAYSGDYALGPGAATSTDELQDKMTRDFVLVARAQESCPVSMRALMRTLERHWPDGNASRWDEIARRLHAKAIIQVSRSNRDADATGQIREIWFVGH